MKAGQTTSYTAWFSLTLLAATQSTFFGVFAFGMILVLMGHLRNLWPLPWFARVTLIGIISSFLWFTRGFYQPHAGPFIAFEILFLLHATSGSPSAILLRILCANFAVVIAAAHFRPEIGVPISILMTMYCIARLISTSSGMSLKSSLWWFAKRSLRLETIFVIALVGGLTAIGLRGAQSYSNLQAGQTGMANSLMPGDVGHLALSDAIALRVRFDRDPTIQTDSMYFRAQTMERVTGFIWQPGTSRLRPAQKNLPDDVSYQISLSPRYSTYAPVLDHGVVISSKANPAQLNFGRDNGVFVPFNLSSKWSVYHAKSRITAVSPNEESDEDQGQNLQLPKKVTNRVRELGESLVGPQKSAMAFIANLKLHFYDEHFVYTLVPGEGSRSVDDFLFNSKAGFCEHFAAATTLLARIAGIPARIVTGFLGGTWESSTRTLLIRDLDAHAWSEIWDRDTHSWIRIDPVTFLAPDRINMGSEEWLRSIGAPLPPKSATSQNLLYAAITMQIDAITEWIQNDFLEHVVSLILDYGTLLMTTGLAGILISYFLSLRRPRTKVVAYEKVDKIIKNLNRELTPSGHSRLTGESVMSWLNRSARHLVELQEDLHSFACAHEHYCYSKAPQANDIEVMTSALRNIRKWTHKKRPHL